MTEEQKRWKNKIKQNKINRSSYRYVNKNIRSFGNWIISQYVICEKLDIKIDKIEKNLYFIFLLCMCVCVFNNGSKHKSIQ